MISLQMVNAKKDKLEHANSKDRLKPADLLRFAIWFGILSGLAEVVLPQLNELRGGRVVFLRIHRVWMSPSVNLVIFGILGLIILPFLLHLSRSTAVLIVFIILSSLFFLNVLLLNFTLLSRIHFTAKVILAIGLSIAMQRLIAWSRINFEKVVRCTTVPLLLLVLILTMIAGGWQCFLHFQEWGTVADLPDPPESAPNILLIVLDTVRAESTSLYGYDRETTPFLKSFAKEGILFQNAIASSSWTLPSYASLYTGRFLHETGVNFNTPLDSTYPTISEILRKRGFATAGFVANTGYCSAKRGIARGFIHYEDKVTFIGRLGYSSSLIRFALSRNSFRQLIGYHDWLGRKRANRITDDFLRWLHRIQNKHKFFASLNYFDAHQPYLPPLEFKEMFGTTDYLISYLTRYSGGEHCSPRNTSSKEIQSMHNAYDGAIAYIDSELDRLFSELRRRDILDRTFVIIASDHGEEFGEHDTFGHGNDLHIQSIHVPLILRLPHIIPSAVKVKESINLRDIPATIVDLLDLPDDGHFPGQSLLRYCDNSHSEETKNNEYILSETNYAPFKPEWIPVHKGPMKSLITGNMHYIRNGDGSEEVYNLCSDPIELNDLIHMPQGVEAAKHARLILQQIIP